MRIVIAEDDALLREGLVLLLRSEGFEVAAAVDHPGDLVASVETAEPDMAVVDVRMPPTYTDEGLQAALEARRRVPGLAILALSAFIEDGYAGDLLAAGGGGAGYLLKERVSDVAVLVDALRRIDEGECVIDPTIVAQLLRKPRAEGPLDALTPREREVLGAMAEGCSNNAIAERLYLSPKTVEANIHRILGKLGIPEAPDVNRRVRAVLAYLRST